MEENEDYGLPNVEYSPIDREAQGASGKSAQPNKSKMSEKKKTNNNTPAILAVVFILLAVLVVGYFFVIKPNMDATAEQERLAAEQAQIEAEAQAEKEREEARLAAEEEERLAAEAAEAEAEAAEPETGTITVLSAKTGMSYVVVGSFFDGDMAQDAGNKLAGEGVSTYILEPVGDVKFYRLAVESFDNYGDASAAIENYRGTYGDEIWALKY